MVRCGGGLPSRKGNAMKAASLPQSIEILKLFDHLTQRRTAGLLSTGLLRDIIEVVDEDGADKIDRQELRFFLKLDWHEHDIYMNYDVPWESRLAQAKETVYSDAQHYTELMDVPQQTKYSGKVTLPVTLVRFIDHPTDAHILSLMTIKGFRPLLIEEHVQFNCTFPFLKIKNRVTSFGTIVKFKPNGNVFYPESEGVTGGERPLQLSITRVGVETHFNRWYAFTRAI
jgi:hypothetical protein